LPCKNLSPSSSSIPALVLDCQLPRDALDVADDARRWRSTTSVSVCSLGKGGTGVQGNVQGGCGSVWDPEPSKERVGDWGGPATVWSLMCVAETRATRPNGEWGYSIAANAGPRVPSGVTLKRRCTYRPSVIYLIVNKLLSLSLSLSLSRVSAGVRRPPV